MIAYNNTESIYRVLNFSSPLFLNCFSIEPSEDEVKNALTFTNKAFSSTLSINQKIQEMEVCFDYIIKFKITTCQGLNVCCLSWISNTRDRLFIAGFSSAYIQQEAIEKLINAKASLIDCKSQKTIQGE